MLAVLIGGSFARPAVAQNGNSSRISMTHLVSVTVAPRVKVKATPLSLNTGSAAPAAVKLAHHGIGGAIGVSIRATQAWVLSLSSAPASDTVNDSPLRWSSTPTGEFSPLTSADTVLLAGGRAESSADTAVFFSSAARASADSGAIFLTVSAP